MLRNDCDGLRPSGVGSGISQSPSDRIDADGECLVRHNV